MISRDYFYISPERARFVTREIAEGSEPGVRFYILVVVSTMIAAFGLTMNSTAVIIGAMLVAPLMTPIFGIALALIRSDAHLLGRAALAEIAGVFAAILMGFILGLVYPGLEPTPEMLSRTQPQLFDLLVAIFSGIAGAYALVDEKISPALPGVAIATAIVPPLANTGLCFSLGAYAGGVGSFLLFFSNFLSILLVASIVFWFFRMTGRHHDLDKQVIIKRFSLPIVGFFVIALILTQTLRQINHDRYITNTIENILTKELADLPSTNFDKMVYRIDKDKIHVFAHAHSATVISPTQVTRVQSRLTEQLKIPIELTIQSTLASTVSALDVYSQVTEMDMDGRFLHSELHPRVLQTKIVDSAIRNYLVDKPTASLHRVRLLKKNDQTIAMAMVSGFISPDKTMIKEIELLLRDKIQEPELQLVVQFLKLDLYDREGYKRFELTGIVDLTPDQKEMVAEVGGLITERFNRDSEFSLAGMDYTLIDDILTFFLETTGTRMFPISDVDNLEKTMEKKLGKQVRLYVISTIATVASSSGYESYAELSSRITKKLEPKNKKAMKEILENSNL